MIIYSHQHFCKLIQVKPATPADELAATFDLRWLDGPKMAPIRRDWMPEDLAPRLKASGVDRSIIVQTQHSLNENQWAVDYLAAENDAIAGVVGWVDLASPQCEEQVLAWKAKPKFVGVRHIAQDEPDDNWLIRPEVMNGLGVLQKHKVPFDVLIFVKHLRHVPTLARAFPTLPMVIDHLAKPQIRDHAINDWLPGFRAAAAFPNVWCKLSGMVTEADWKNWKPADLRPCVQHALELFGPDRLMFGSDWPVCELAATYAQVKDALVENLGPISKAEHEKIFGGTAARFYGIS